MDETKPQYFLIENRFFPDGVLLKGIHGEMFVYDAEEQDWFSFQLNPSRDVRLKKITEEEAFVYILCDE